jgi:hypothetical protein
MPHPKEEIEEAKAVSREHMTLSELHEDSKKQMAALAEKPVAEAVPIKEEPKKEDDHTMEVGSHLKHWTEITKFPVFPEGTTSILSKVLTYGMWTSSNGPKSETF